MASESRGVPRGVQPGRLGALAWAVPAVALTAGVALIAMGGASPAGSWALAAVAIVTIGLVTTVFVRQRVELLRLRDSRRSLAASDRNARDRYESVAAGILAISADGRPRAANRALLSLLGYAGEREFLGADFRDHTYAGPGTFDALLQRARQGGELPAIEMTLRRRDGVPVMLAANLRTQWDEEGAVAGFEATVLDIGELKLADRQRRSVERRFRNLFDSNAVGFMFGNLRRSSLDEANECLREMLGVRASQLPIHLDSLVSSDEASLADAIGTALESGGHTPPLERTYVRSDGRKVGVLMCASIVDPLQGDFIGIVIEREPAAILTGPAAEAERCHESILDALPYPLTRFSTSGTLTYCNRRFLDWFGFPKVPLGWSFAELLGAGGPRRADELLARVIGGATEHLSLDGRRADGQFGRLAVTIAPHVRPDGKASGCIAIFNEEDPRARRVPDPGVPMGPESTYTD